MNNAQLSQVLNDMLNNDIEVSEVSSATSIPYMRLLSLKEDYWYVILIFSTPQIRSLFGDSHQLLITAVTDALTGRGSTLQVMRILRIYSRDASNLSWYEGLVSEHRARSTDIILDYLAREQRHDLTRA